MRVLVVGAGASIEEAIRGNVPDVLRPPTMANFAKKMWDSPLNSFYCYWFDDYLKDQGTDPGTDPTSVFIAAAADSAILSNIERLFEYCWINRHTKPRDYWENFIHHGVLRPLNDLLLAAFYVDGEIKQLDAGKTVSGFLNDGDVVLNLNADF